MLLLRQDVLQEAGKKNKPLKSWLDDWMALVSSSTWTSLKDIHKAYPSAKGVTLKSGTVVTVFKAKGNSYRLLTRIDFEAEIIEFLQVITHAEYDKNLWKERY
jgi:mRNA interferase HigB